MITLIPYKTTWKKNFDKEKASLCNLGIDNITRIKHIGSTSIPGMFAKPVIDILIGVKNLDNFATAEVQRIESLGYRYNPTFETIFPFRRYFQKENSEGLRTHQIHLVHYPSQWYEKHILFRDYLRCHDQVAKAYAELKIELAKQFDNTIDYANAKNDFCQEVDRQAFCNFDINRPFLESERLYGFIPQLACHDDYVTMCSNPEFSKVYGIAYTYKEALLRLKSDMNHWNQYAFGPLMWYEKQSHTYVGRGGPKLFKRTGQDNDEVELTYQVKREFWNKGFASEMGVSSVIYAVDDLNLNNLICFAAYNNNSSLRVMQKLGFVFEEDFIHANVIHKLHRLVYKR
jgi:GrpB-like predicted nucleotidyltransferase (UPF0157 family)/RimJ/RimL family protein N-acetyltransferase